MTRVAKYTQSDKSPELGCVNTLVRLSTCHPLQRKESHACTGKCAKNAANDGRTLASGSSAWNRLQPRRGARHLKNQSLEDRSRLRIQGLANSRSARPVCATGNNCGRLQSLGRVSRRAGSVMISYLLQGSYCIFLLARSDRSPLRIRHFEGFVENSLCR